MQVDICRHIKTSGTQCRAVALTGCAFCYFHRRLHTSHAPYRPQATRGYLLPGQHIQLAPLEDRDSVLLAVSQVVNALATGALDIKRATALFYGLQVAGAHAPQVRTEPDPQSSMRTVHIAGDLSDTPGVDLANPGYVCEIEPDPFELESDSDTQLDLGDSQAPLLDAPNPTLQLAAPPRPALPSQTGETPIRQPSAATKPQPAPSNRQLTTAGGIAV
jgi:hypothetical protein